MDPIKILILTANPRNTGSAPLGLNAEVRRIEEALQRSRCRDRFQVISKGAVRTTDLRRALLDHEPQIVHFAGHGEVINISRADLANQGHEEASSSPQSRKFSPISENADAVRKGGLVFEDERGQAKLVSTEALARLFGVFETGEIKCVLLNACYSEVQATAIHQFVDCVIGMNQPIGDKAAVDFAEGFYDALGSGRSYEDAYNIGCSAIDLEGSSEYSTPVLKYRKRLNAEQDSTMRIVGEELRLPQREYGDTVSLGLNALTELMQHTEARSAVVTFRVDFQAACEQINIIANYKGLHDLLHTLEFQCYNGIVQESKRFPQDETALDILGDHELTLSNIMREVQEIAGRKTIATTEVLWLKDLESAQTELHDSINKLDTKGLGKTIWLLNRILAIQPSRINTSLNSAARTLRLPALVSAMNFIWERLAKSNLNQEKIRQFQSGVEVLEKLNERLKALVIGHDYWQELDLELRRIEANLGKDLIELEMSWPDLKKRAEVLFNTGKDHDQWIVSFQQESHNLDAALATQNPAKIKRSFRMYRRRASDRFYQVDVTLKRLCEELRQVGEPLASVLRIIE